MTCQLKAKDKLFIDSRDVEPGEILSGLVDEAGRVTSYNREGDKAFVWTIDDCDFGQNHVVFCQRRSLDAQHTATVYFVYSDTFPKSDQIQLAYMIVTSDYSPEEIGLVYLSSVVSDALPELRFSGTNAIGVTKYSFGSSGDMTSDSLFVTVGGVEFFSNLTINKLAALSMIN